VYVRAGMLQVTNSPIRIFEVGFGTGLNALVSLHEAQNSNLLIEYTSIEFNVLSSEKYLALNYGSILNLDEAWATIHHANWNEKVKLNDFFTLYKIEADWLSFETDEKFDVVYYDAFAPEKQEEMWSEKLFQKIYNMLNTHGMLVTYSAKGIIKQALRAAGFKIKRLPGPPGKRHMIQAIKI